MRNQNQPALTYESVMAFIKETYQIQREAQEESQRIQREESLRIQREVQEESQRRQEESLRRQREAQEESQRLHKANMADYEKRMKKMEETMGNWSNNHGSFAEEYFFNSFEEGQQDFFGEHFNEIEKNLKSVREIRKREYLKDEYDIVMYNDSYVAIVETKFKAHKNDIRKVLKKAETFRILCPDFKDYKIYLGLASLSFYEELEQECIDQGIAVIKQVGDTVVINDKHLKVF